MERQQNKQVMAKSWAISFGYFDYDEFIKNQAVRFVESKGSAIEKKEISNTRSEVAKKKVGALSICRQTVKIDKDGKLLAEYRSVTAAAKQNGVSADSVYKSCRGMFKQVKGLRFKYKQDFLRELGSGD